MRVPWQVEISYVVVIARKFLRQLQQRLLHRDFRLVLSLLIERIIFVGFKVLMFVLNVYSVTQSSQIIQLYIKSGRLIQKIMLFCAVDAFPQIIEFLQISNILDGGS